MKGRKDEEGRGNAPLTYKKILELAYWGASCYQDDFIYLMNSMECDTGIKKSAAKIKKYREGYELCERQMKCLEEMLEEYERENKKTAR